MLNRHLMRARRQKNIQTNPFNTWRDDNGQITTAFYRKNDCYILRFPELADFEVSLEGKSCECWPVQGCDVGTLNRIFENQVEPLMWSRQGKLVFHASCVACSDATAVAFLGASGMGKSTLAAFFSSNGFAFLTDDGLKVELVGGQLHALPGDPKLFLWKSSYEQFIAQDKESDVTKISQKYRANADVNLRHCPEHRRLVAAFVLEDQGVQHPTTHRINGAHAHFSWQKHCFILDVEDDAALTKNFVNIADYIAPIPTFSLDYPREYSSLGTVLNQVLCSVEHSEVAA